MGGMDIIGRGCDFIESLPVSTSVRTVPSPWMEGKDISREHNVYLIVDSLLGERLPLALGGLSPCFFSCGSGFGRLRGPEHRCNSCHPAELSASLVSGSLLAAPGSVVVTSLPSVN